MSDGVMKNRADARTFCVALGGRWYGRYGLALCPAHRNTRTPALSLADGDGGKLLVHCHAGCSGADVLAALRARGLLEGRSDWRPDHQKTEQNRLDREAKDRRRIEMARRVWAEAGPIAGTLAERYLRSRNITCDLPPTLKFHTECWHGPTATKLPAMIAAIGIGGKITGVHRTFVREPGMKAFGNAKLMLGHCAGGAVRLSGGIGPLVVAEGIETGLSLLSGLPVVNAHVRAALSTSGMSGLILPRDPGELVLAPDGDAPGREAAIKLADRASAAGWHVRVMHCPNEADWNDIASKVLA